MFRTVSSETLGVGRRPASGSPDDATKRKTRKLAATRTAMLKRSRRITYWSMCASLLSGARPEPRPRRGRERGLGWQALDPARRFDLRYEVFQVLTFQPVPSFVGLTTGPDTFLARMTNTGRAYTGMDGMSATMYLSSAALSMVAR